MVNVLLGIANFLAELLGVIGLLVFGFAMAWLMVTSLRQNDKPWPFVAILFFVFFIFTAFVIWRTSPGDFGAYTLGAGGGVIYWGFIQPNLKNTLPPENDKESSIEEQSGS